MDKNTLEKRYAAVPKELRFMRRWVCYRIEDRDGNKTKVPVNAISGSYARCNDQSTWTSFDIAMNGVVKYGCAGLGFMLGNGIFGVDLDNHPDKNGVCMGKEEFDSFSQEFVKELDSYTELSQSGLGIHIICRGSLPEGRRRKGNVEMYDSNRFFAFTGNVVNAKPIEERTDRIVPLWKKWVDDSEDIARYQKGQYENKTSSLYDFTIFQPGDDYEEAPALTDQEVIDKALSAKDGFDFAKLYRGDMSDYSDDHSAADLAFCSKLAFRCNGNKDQMDRIFRSTPLMRRKWDQMRGKDTYGNLTLDKAIQSLQGGYVPMVRKRPFSDVAAANAAKEAEKSASSDNYMNIDSDGNPIFRTKQVFVDYTLDDTGNALRFYDQFGDCFRFNKDDKCFMFRTGKTWVFDNKDIIRKYANKMIDMMRSEYETIRKEAMDLMATDETKGKKRMEYADAFMKNVTRLSNKAGKDAMLNELQSLADIPIRNSEFDRDHYLLNTESGIVDLRTGEISQFDKSKLMSKNTGIKVSFEEPTEWLKFLKGIFERRNPKETEEIINCFQLCAGYSLNGNLDEQVMFVLYGDGSNGKSTFNNVMSSIMGEYAYSVDSNILMTQNNGSNNSAQYTLAELVGIRFLETNETNDGEKLDEKVVKALTGGDKINAQHKYGKPFIISPQFKLWMSTNNLPIIRGTDYGIWRRIFLFPFVRIFTDREKDKDMPRKLAAEYDRILGRCIQGHIRYYQQRDLMEPECLKKAKGEYKDEMDVVTKFINSECDVGPGCMVATSSLYRSFAQWAVENTERKMPQSKFLAQMQKKGYKVVKPMKGPLSYTGIKIAGGGTMYEF